MKLSICLTAAMLVAMPAMAADLPMNYEQLVVTQAPVPQQRPQPVFQGFPDSLSENEGEPNVPPVIVKPPVTPKPPVVVEPPVKPPVVKPPHPPKPPVVELPKPPVKPEPPKEPPVKPPHPPKDDPKDPPKDTDPKPPVYCFTQC